MGDTVTNDLSQSGSFGQDARFDVHALTMLVECGFLTISDLDQKFVDLPARVIVNSGTTRQNHAVSIVVDHIRCRADDANANDSLGEISESFRGEAVAEDEGIEPIQTTKLVERDFTAISRISREPQLVGYFLEGDYLLNPICFGRTRRIAQEFANSTSDQASQAFCNLASHKLVDDVPYKITKSTLL